jgi:hypothetical protein
LKNWYFRTGWQLAVTQFQAAACRRFSGSRSGGFLTANPFEIQATDFRSKNPF